MKDTNVTPFPKEKTEKKDSSLVSSLSPREIVSELDRYVVGQNKAKKAVAIALRIDGDACFKSEMKMSFT